MRDIYYVIQHKTSGNYFHDLTWDYVPLFDKDRKLKYTKEHDAIITMTALELHKDCKVVRLEGVS